MIAITRIYFQSARRTGRTTAMLKNLKDGDRICFTNSRTAQQFKKLCNANKVSVEYIVVSSKNPEDLLSYRKSIGRTILDHVWIEEYYLNEIEKIKNEIDYFEQKTSGHNEFHEKTIEMSKWNF